MVGEGEAFSEGEEGESGREREREKEREKERERERMEECKSDPESKRSMVGVDMEKCCSNRWE